ncbi:dihydrodipicolinate synthase family protein [Paenibacillus sp. GCM10027628]|uniref:dihydrodipicolinate synthase family protein n=1 Tax=Paenibacillus sp. GCM10027628 TaxID=3273413 RepID=UPI003633CF24
MKTIPDGVWPTMVTPFTDNNEIDYTALDRAVEWYIQNGVDGFVLITNRLAGQDESDHIWKNNLERLLHELPHDLPLGLYECPADFYF